MNSHFLGGRIRPRLRPKPRPGITILLFFRLFYLNSDFCAEYCSENAYSVSSGARYRLFGRYRAPPKNILGNPTVTFQSLKFARKNCQRVARMRRAWAFALRFGRQCYIAQKSPRKFTKFGLPRTKMPGALKVYIARGKKKTGSLRK